MSGAPETADPGYSHCDAELRAGDRDRWLACLFAPVALRPHLDALYAFNLEIARVREIVSDPRLGEMRFQWWRDAIEGVAMGDAQAHPVAAALGDTIRRFQLPTKALIDLIDARTFDLYDDPMPTLLDLEGYCGETSSALMRLASLVLGQGGDPGGADAVGHAGVAYALMGLLRALPWHAARGQVYVPADLLAKHGAESADLLAGRLTPQIAAALAELRGVAHSHVEAAWAAAPQMQPAARAALLPLALVAPYLAQMERRRFDPFGRLVDLPQWRRQWSLWRAARRL